MSKSIGIIGSGIAGSSLAIFLSRAGFKVTIFEKLENPSPVGSGIMLQPPAVKTLELLGVKDHIVNNGYKIHGFKGVTRSGKKVIDFEFAKVNPDLFGLGVHRGSIFSNLMAKASVAENVTIHYGKEIVEINDHKESVKLTDSNGQEYSVDLLVVANGSGSMLRKQFPEIVVRANQQKYGALWTTLPIGDNKEYHHNISHVYSKSESMYGLMPIGFATNSHKGDSQINFFCAVSSAYLKDWKEDTFESWKARSYDLASKYAPFIDQITDFNQLTPTTYFDAKLKPFYSGRIAFIGDACHALSPHLSAGCNLALMDALLLSECLSVYDSYLEAYQEYFKRRKDQVNYYYFISRLVTPLFQSKANLSWVRDHMIPLFYKLPLTRKLMVETIAGVKNNMFSKIQKKYYV